MKIKTLFAASIFVIMVTMTVQAEVLPLINYQGKLTDLNGVPLNNIKNDPADGQIDITLTILDENEATIVWGPEEHLDVRVENGLFSVLLGETVAINGKEDFPGATVFLEVRVTHTLDATVIQQTLDPRKEIVSVAYAINSDMVDGLHADNLVDVAGDTMTGALTLSGDPTLDLHAATRQYVDAQVAGAGNNTLVGLTDTTISIPAAGHVLIYDDTDSWDNRLMSGDVSIAADGTATIQASAVTSDKIDDGTITDDDISATASIAATKINEDDPKVGTLADNYVPRWDADAGPAGAGALVTGSIYDPGTGNIGIGKTPDAGIALDVNGWIQLNGTDFRIQAAPDPWGTPVLGFRGIGSQIGYTVLVPNFTGFRVMDCLNIDTNLELIDKGLLFIPRINSFVKAWAYHRYSDSRIKLNQEPLSKYGRREILALEVKEFFRAEWTKDMETGEIEIHPERGTNDFGLVAQDVYNIIPEAVSKPEDESKEFWSLDYGKLIPVLIKGMQEQDQIIQEQQEINEVQEAKITSLEERIEEQHEINEEQESKIQSLEKRLEAVEARWEGGS